MTALAIGAGVVPAQRESPNIGDREELTEQAAERGKGRSADRGERDGGELGGIDDVDVNV